MEQEVTMEELLELMKSQEGDFIIHVGGGEEADSDEE